MPTLTRPLPPLLAAALTVVCVEASAAGFGSASSTTLLGQTLDFVVQVRTDAGETISAECVVAEVLSGERRVPARVIVEPAGADLVRLRVATSQAIDEPVVNVGLSLGCPPRLARRYVVFAEPPSTAAPPAMAVVPPTPVTSAGEPAGAAGLPPASAPAAPEAAPGQAGEGAPAAAPAPPQAAVRRPAPAAGERFVLRARPPGAAAPGARPPRPRPPRPAVAQAPRPQPPTAPRLRLEAAEPPKPPQAEAIAQAMEAVAQAASAARAAEAAASAAAARMAGLERTIEQLRSEARTSQEQSNQLRQRLAASEETSRWMLPLAAAVLVLGALAGWLGWRLSALQRERRVDWRAPGAGAVAPAPSPAAQDSTQLSAPTTSFVTVPAVGVAPAGARWHRGTPAWPPPAVTPVDPWVSSDLAQTEAAPLTPAEGRAESNKRAASPGLGGFDEGAPRDVTIEELIDLEQQAEFFVVLGQDEAAIDLLMEHLRSTGGGSPLPYLKLLEIYRRRGDREAYERTRTRFNHRFNAYAPEWGADLAAGRSLDDYPGVVPRLQQVWPRPLDAMAELEALLFRKSRGELFDLPAYREVLLLYSLARDLLDRKSAEAGNVDFVLPPMSEATEFGATAPVPYLGLERDNAPTVRDEGERPTKPLDFDVTRSGIGPGTGRPSLFGDLDAPTTPGHHRP